MFQGLNNILKIAIIGSGISGLIAAYLLDQKYEVTVYEMASYVGGHARSYRVNENNINLWIDTGFVMFNKHKHPNFFKLMSILDVELLNSTIGVGVSIPKINLEYNGSSFNGLFAQRKNLFNPAFWCMSKDITNFNKSAQQCILENNNKSSFSEFVNSLNLSRYCKEYYLSPIIAGIWSIDPTQVLNTPALVVCKSLENHGLLNGQENSQWYCVNDGSHEYIKAIVSKLKKVILTNNGVRMVARDKDGVLITTANGQTRYDKVIIATHSDQALKLLHAPSDQEVKILSAFRYHKNEVVLHTDLTLLSNNQRVWAGCNYKMSEQQQVGPCVTYNMNMLQNLRCQHTYCISLNQTAQIDPSKIITKFIYAHPVYDQTAIGYQSEHATISGVNNTYYCGAYWGDGFHEDGLNSGLKVVAQIDKELELKIT